MLKANYIRVNIIRPLYFTELTGNVFCDWKMNIVLCYNQCNNGIVYFCKKRF